MSVTQAFGVKSARNNHLIGRISRAVSTCARTHYSLIIYVETIVVDGRNKQLHKS